jgi:DNA-binding NtrC family response regulator
VEALGSNQVEPLDCRVIAATSRDLPAMVAAGTFRADLYYRLNVLPIRLPPLRERLSDLDALADHLLDDIALRIGLPAPKALADDALELLASQAWPGNIRELRNALEQACLMTDELVLAAADFRPLLGRPPAAASAGVAAAANATEAHKPLHHAVAELEAHAIREALKATNGNKLAAARMLGIARATLYEKLGQLG